MNPLNPRSTSMAAPRKVHAKLDLLQTYRRKIAELERQLAETRTLYDALSNEVGVYAPPIASIQALPDELFCLIIQCALRNDDVRIQRLVLVSKYFYRIVMNTPTFWTHIKITTINHYRAETLPKLSYIQACLDHSQNLHLDINLCVILDFSKEEFIREEVANNLESLVAPNQVDDVHAMLEGLNLDFECSAYENNLNHILNLVRLITGPGGSNMRRWKSLLLELPGLEALCDALERLFIGITPNLRTLIIVDTGYRGFEESVTKLGLFPDLSGVQVFGSRIRNFWTLGLNKAALRKLDMVLGPEGSLTPLSLCTSLESLKMKSYPRRGERAINETVVCLPRLRSLHLEGDIGSIIGKLSVPLLDELVIESLNCTSCLYPLPAASTIIFTLLFPKYRSLNMEAILRHILCDIPSTRALTLRGFPGAVVSEVVEQLRASNSYPSRLQLILRGGSSSIDNVLVINS